MSDSNEGFYSVVMGASIVKKWYSDNHKFRFGVNGNYIGFRTRRIKGKLYIPKYGETVKTNDDLRLYVKDFDLGNHLVHNDSSLVIGHKPHHAYNLQNS